ncbi:MAG: bifunctional 5,10-methylenetetrahydrofolate dehydrogenase/5,10-methenyltetrahydrofolate cyclohydrolase [candidate division SR1 bacterium]|nr:bifunctional 5,10-methylenetetrahydrofolate dehydrogenase/5,10-methenyltetrahydrofolate cyclohydrolase [candidate division SR1 bacterium]
MLLYGKPVAELHTQKLKSDIGTYFSDGKHYVAILFFGTNSSSAVYVRNKQAFAQKIGLPAFIFGQEHKEQNLGIFEDLSEDIVRRYENTDQVFNLIDRLNLDERCVGIMIQMPLPDFLKHDRDRLVSAVDEKKDIDGLGGGLVGKSFANFISFTPATPKAVMSLLDYYELGNLKGRRVAIIGQSIVVGKPLALECLKRGAIVQCFDISNTEQEIQEGCQQAEYIFSGTGVIHLVNENYVNKEKNQILVDIGYGHLNGKAAGDIDFESVEGIVKYITPVPGGVGPLTIVSLFENVISLRKNYGKI